jgi:threonyl-tRNA synthetase
MWQKIKETPALGVGIAAVALGLAAYFTWAALNPPMRPLVKRVWFYDLASNQPFIASDEDWPPIEAPSKSQVEGGPAGVRLYRYGCEDCSAPFNAYLLKYTAEALQKTKEGDLSALSQGVMVRAMEGGDWVVGNSEEGNKITASMIEKCPGKRPIQCNPVDEGK